MNELLQTALRRILPGAQDDKSTAGGTGGTVVTPCALKRDWTLGKVAVFQLDAQSLQYCIAQRGVTSTKLVDFGKIYRPRTGKQLADHAAFLSDEITRLKKQHSLAGARFGLSISSSEVAVRTLRIPKMPHAEEKRAVYFEGDKRVPFTLNDAYWSYRRCERIDSDASSDVSITLMATLKSAVDDILGLFERNNISFDFISQDVEALGLALGQLKDFDESRPYGLLNIRPARTDISLHTGTRLKFLHCGAFGSLALGQSLQFNSANTSFLPQALENFAEGLANIIQQALDYYGAQQRFENISTFYIYGDFSYSAELIDNLSERFGVKFERFPVEVFDDFALADSGLREIVPVALPVVATATSAFALSDFTPATVLAQNLQRAFMRRAIAAAAITILAVGATWTSERWRARIANNALERTTQTVRHFEGSAAYAGYRILKEELLRQKNIIHELEKKDSEHYLALKEIAALTPSSIRLDYLQYFPRKRGVTSTLNGSVVSRLVAPEVILAEYASRLGGSVLFSDVRLKSHNKRIEGDTRTVTFSIDLNAAL